MTESPTDTALDATSEDVDRLGGEAVTSETDETGGAAIEPAEPSSEAAGGDGDGVDEGPGTAARSSRSAPSAERLDEEGDVAADYLEELLDILDLDGDIDIDVENGRASVSVVADPGSERSLKRLVGDDGVVLEALQELTRLAVQAKTGERTRLMLDVAGFRAGRRAELERLAQTAIDRVKTDGAAVALEPMSPFERKVVHDVVAAAGLRSESDGEDAGRHVVVLPLEA